MSSDEVHRNSSGLRYYSLQKLNQRDFDAGEAGDPWSAGIQACVPYNVYTVAVAAGRKGRTYEYACGICFVCVRALSRWVCCFILYTDIVWVREHVELGEGSVETREWVKWALCKCGCWVGRRRREGRWG